MTIELLYASGHMDSKTALIFLHGFRSDAATAWGGGLKEGWPGLLAATTDAVTFVADYPNDVVAGGKRTPYELRTAAEKLAEAMVRLEIHRKRIVILGHSFGGLLAKELIRFCEGSTHPNIRDVAANTKGLVFFGTPHFGHDLASRGVKVLAWVARQVPFLPQRLHVASHSLVMLDKHNAEIMTLHCWFLARYGQMPVLSYVENIPLNPVFQVEAYEAKLHSPGEEAITVNFNHVDMCKISSIEDDRFKRIASFIRGLPQLTEPRISTILA